MSLLHFGETAEHGHVHGTGIEGLDPRVKLVCAGALALWIGLTPATAGPALGLLIVGLIVVGLLAQIPPATLIVRASAALPFVLVPGVLRALSGDVDLAALLLLGLRGYAAAMVATLLVSVTPFADLLAAAAALKVPDLMVQTTALVYRYLLVLRARAAAMALSALCRGYGPRTPGRVSVAGSMLGALLIRSLDRGDRVHRGMLARGYQGRLPSMRVMVMRPTDWAVGAAVVLGALISTVAFRAGAP